MAYVSVSCFVRRKQLSPEPMNRKEVAKPEALTNGKWSGPSNSPQNLNFQMSSPDSPDYDDAEEDHKSEPIDRR